MNEEHCRLIKEMLTGGVKKSAKRKNRKRSVGPSFFGEMELKKYEVEIADVSRGILRCAVCSTTWRVKYPTDGKRFKRHYWVCPLKCNVTW